MKELRIFLSGFFRNQGHFVFVSLLIGKVTAFISSLYIIRLLPAADFGQLSIAASLFAVFSTFSGFGSCQSLLRHGALLSDDAEKQSLASYFLKSGFVYQLLLTAVFLCVALFYVRNSHVYFYIFAFFSVRLVGIYFFLHLQSVLRIEGKNRDFARLNNVVNISALVFSLFGAWLFGLPGYLCGMAIAPFLSFFWFKNYRGDALQFSKKKLWDYATQSALMAFLSDALFSADVLLMGFLLSEADVARYKVAIFLPSNITFLSLTFMQADFPILAKNFQNKSYLISYIKSYYKVFIPVCVFLFVGGFLFRNDLIVLLFEHKYSDIGNYFAIFLFVFLLNMLFRNLYGNLLSAVGLVRVNTWVSMFALAFLLFGGFAFSNRYGVLGMVLAQSGALFLSGVIYGVCFWRYLGKIK